MNKKVVFKRAVAIVVAIAVVFGISAIVATVIHNRDNVDGGVVDKPVSSTVKDGLSAYELAVQYGYEGTVQEWLNSLSGKSAYQIAVDNGYSGTESEWLKSLEAKSEQNDATIKSASFSSKTSIWM